MPKTKTIKCSIRLKAIAEDLYKTIMDSKQHSELTGGEALIEPVVGGKFTAFDGWVSGSNLELEPFRKIVQSWLPQDDKWPQTITSKVTFEFTPDKDGYTLLDLTHENVPVVVAASYEQGWEDNYFKPLRNKYAS